LPNSNFSKQVGLFMKISSHFCWCVMSGALLGGCAAPSGYDQSKPKPASPPVEVPAKTRPVMPTALPPPPPEVVVPVEPSASEKSLAVALASFDRGEYSLAMKQLQPLTTDTELGTPDRLKAIKSLAFAQCLTRAVLACRKTFETAFQLDPDFDLAPTEQGHPVWGPQFLKARQNTKRK
jgi:hypothetical protein